jgi:hypothetical protein
MAPFEIIFNPEIQLINGTIIRNGEDATIFLRAHEARPGVDERDEILHLLERAQTPEQIASAGDRFREWLRELEVTNQ